MSLEFCEVERHYDLLIEEGDDPTKDGAELREYMDKWDGLPFIDEVLINHDKDVLEIGVGTGRLALRVAPFCKRFVGIDLSKKTANRAKENLQEYKNASIVCGDFLGFPFHSLFDVVYSSLTFMHIKEKFRAIEKVAGLLRKGGRFVLSIDKSQNNLFYFKELRYNRFFRRFFDRRSVLRSIPFFLRPFFCSLFPLRPFRLIFHFVRDNGKFEKEKFCIHR